MRNYQDGKAVPPGYQIVKMTRLPQEDRESADRRATERWGADWLPVRRYNGVAWLYYVRKEALHP